jgi:hypothetical protein
MGSPTESRDYTVKLLLPEGFGGDTGPWTSSLVAGRTSELATTVTAPLGGMDFFWYAIAAEAKAVAGDNATTTTRTTILVE